MATTNGGSGHQTGANVPDLPFADGTTLYNVLDNDDKITVNGGSASIYISDGNFHDIMHPMTVLEGLPRVYYASQ